MENERFEFRLSAGRRRERAELAAETGISSADLARLAIKQFLERPGRGCLWAKAGCRLGTVTSRLNAGCGSKHRWNNG